MSAKSGFDLLLLILHHPERSELDSQPAFVSLAATKALFSVVRKSGENL